MTPNETLSYRFPDRFTWGTATAAYQIEGAVDRDGKGRSIWDDFVARRGTIERGETGIVACEHYDRFEADIALMAKLGYAAYRFSVSWPRIIPAGSGTVNVAGLDFYDRLVDTLLRAGIEPFVTLYHWDLPATLQEQGGWYRRETAEAFAEYADVTVRRLGDRVTSWITLNEPWVVTALGHVLGVHAPGKRRPYRALRVAHNLLYAHGRAVQAMRAAGAGTEHRIGITNNLSPIHDRDLPRTHRYARRAHALYNELWMDPIFFGRYPEELTAVVERQNRGNLRPGDLAVISQPIDFIGVNTYTRTIVKRAFRPLYPFKPVTPRYDGIETTEMGWEVHPQSLFEIVTWIARRYGNPPIYITENGFADAGEIEDSARIEYLRRHLVAVHTAITAGADVRGYFVWTFMDNFEWAHGYRPRFGLVHVDFDGDRSRTVKASGRWFGDVCRTNRVPPGSAGPPQGS